MTDQSEHPITSDIGISYQFSDTPHNSWKIVAFTTSTTRITLLVLSPLLREGKSFRFDCFIRPFIYVRNIESFFD